MTAEHAHGIDAGGDVAAQIVHRLTCNRCRMGWTCGGLGVDDFRNAVKIADLMATHNATAADAVLAEARRLCCGENPSAHHAATDKHSELMAFAGRLAGAVRGR